MTKTLLAFAGAAVLSAASLTLAHATPASDAWIARTKAAFAERIATAGLNDDGKAVALKVTIAANPRDSRLRVARTSGSRDFDDAARAAARAADLDRPPPELVGSAVTFTLGDPAAGPSAAAR